MKIYCHICRCLHGVAMSLSSTWFLCMSSSYCWWVVTQTEFLSVSTARYVAVSLAKERMWVQHTVSWLHSREQQNFYRFKNCFQMQNLCWKYRGSVFVHLSPLDDSRGFVFMSSMHVCTSPQCRLFPAVPWYALMDFPKTSIGSASWTEVK